MHHSAGHRRCFLCTGRQQRGLGAASSLTDSQDHSTRSALVPSGSRRLVEGESGFPVTCLGRFWVLPSLRTLGQQCPLQLGGAIVFYSNKDGCLSSSRNLFWYRLVLILTRQLPQSWLSATHYDKCSFCECHSALFVLWALLIFQLSQFVTVCLGSPLTC